MQFSSVLLFALAIAQGPEVGQFVRFRGARPGSLLSIAPLDGAEFIPNQHFDVSIELHSIGNSTQFPDISALKATINGKTLEEVLGKSYSPAETWTFTYNKDMESVVNGVTTPVSVSRLALRSGVLTAPGTYKISVQVGDQTAEATWTVHEPTEKSVKNLVLFIGDGMAPAMVAAARTISKSTNFGKYGSNTLFFERMGSFGKVITNGFDSIITDSANSASAYTTGQKGVNSALNIYPDTSRDVFDDPKVETIGEYIRNNNPGMCIGIVTTAEVQDATPASVYSHTKSRDMKADINDQMINKFSYNNITWDPKPVKADVLLGGGGKYFCSKKNAKNCASKSDRDFYAEYAAMGYKVVTNKADLDALKGTEPVVGIFHSSNMNVWLDRNIFTDNTNAPKISPLGTDEGAPNQPGLEQMTMKAIEIMSAKCKDGFFLMSEAASVDKAMHGIDYDRGLADLLELDRTVKRVADWAKANAANGETGIMVTADHAQAFDVYGTVDTEYFNKLAQEATPGSVPVPKLPALQIYGEAGFPDTVIDDAGMPTKWNGRFRLLTGKVDTVEHREDWQVKSSYRVQAVEDANLGKQFGGKVYVANPAEKGVYYAPTTQSSTSSTVHSLVDVDLYCAGPAAFKASCVGVHDNTDLFFIMSKALGLGKKQ